MPVEYVNLPIGPDDSLACVQLALYLGTWQDAPVAVLVMADDERRTERSGHPSVHRMAP
jgi:hypothetical protein